MHDPASTARIVMVGAWSRTNEAVDEVAVEMDVVFRQQGEFSGCQVRRSDKEGRILTRVDY